MSFLLPMMENTKYPSGRKVISAMSLAMSMEPMKVMHKSASAAVRAVPVSRMIRCARTEKKWMFFSAHTTASVTNRQHSVFRS